MINLFDLTGRTAIITGGGRGIGYTITKSLAQAGANIVVASRSLDTCQKALKELQINEERGLAVSLDVTQDESVKQMVQSVLEKFGSVDILVNNSGISPFMAPLDETKLSGFDKIMETNVKGALRCIREVSQHMKSQKSGKIINISSSAANTPVRGLGAYSISKAALLSLTKTLAAEWGRHNIQVNAIAPGFMDVGVAEFVNGNESVMKRVVDNTPLGRTGRVEELEGAVLFLASDASSYVTGQTIFIDGGAANC
jgi:NAD(P)-dependent dehydrogenase (short-subunit alcohol dehydrogenase family)